MLTRVSVRMGAFRSVVAASLDNVSFSKAEFTPGWVLRCVSVREGQRTL